MGLIARLLRRQPNVNASLMIEQLHGQAAPMLQQEIWTTHARPELCAGHDHSVNGGTVVRAPYVSKDGKSVLVDIRNGSKTHHVVLARRANGEWVQSGVLFSTKRPRDQRTDRGKYYRPVKSGA